MGMFPDRKKPAVPKVTEGNGKVTFDVRYSGGRKSFDDRKDANAFADEVRLDPKGWAEISRVTSIVVSPR